MRKKILLSNCRFSTKNQKHLAKGLGKTFALRSIEDINDSELADVEIMLLDTVVPSAQVWLNAEKISKMPKLRLVQSHRAGVDNIDFQQIPMNVTVCGNVGAYSEPMAEHTLGMILYLAKDLGVRNSKLRSGIVDVHDSILLKGKTLGVVGAGGIGQAVAKLSRSVGMKTLGVNTSGKAVPNFDKTFALGKVDEVLRSSDVIVLSLPLTLKTLHIIDGEKLSLMKKTCILINVARGHLIVQEALYNHLSQNPQFKCGLDVWWRFPTPNKPFTPDFPFLELANFVGTPHCSGFVPEEYESALDHALDNVVRFVKGKKPKGLADRQDYEGLRELIATPRAR